MIKVDKGIIKCKGNIVVQLAELASIIMYLKEKANTLDPTGHLKQILNKVLLKAFTANDAETFLKTDEIDYNKLNKQLKEFKELDDKLRS